jgi:GNAT superfamily N-acetyltransferase
MKIRQAVSSDINAIIKLLEELGRPKDASKSDKIEFTRLVHKYMHGKNTMILVAEDNHDIIGMASLVFVSRLNQTRQELWIPDMIVSKDYQNNGVGRALAKKFTKIAKKNNCFRIRLESGNSRKHAHVFYKRNGFEAFAISFRKQI